MHQTRKGNQCYLGMKAHIGLDGDIRPIYSLTTTSAKVHVLQVIDPLFHCEEKGSPGRGGFGLLGTGKSDPGSGTPGPQVHPREARAIAP